MAESEIEPRIPWSIGNDITPEPRGLCFLFNSLLVSSKAKITLSVYVCVFNWAFKLSLTKVLKYYLDDKSQSQIFIKDYY